MSQGQTSQRLRPFKPLRFGRYTLLMPLSTGGMGEIFLARLEGSHGFDKLCVIKKILPHLAQDQDFVSRFVDEAHILVKLSHGSIAQVLDMGVHEHEPYIALEFVDGKDLRRVLSRMRERQLPLPLSFVLSVMTRVLDALAYAHRKRGDDDAELNLVHRDVSPQNVLISYEGEVKVIDFGLAKSALSLSKTNPSIVMGKFMYMAPEQARHRTVDRRSDLYAVGLCLWELVTGKNAFEEVPQGALMGEVANPSIPPLNTIEPLCPQVLSDVVSKALSLDPAQRFQTAEEFRGRLQSILQDIDPQAGAESTSRFMRDAFSAEYQAERRMLNTVKEQAKALEVEEPEPEPAAPEETQQNAPSPFATHPTPLAMPAITIRIAEETPLGRPALQPEALSFQPTRKPAGTPTTGSRKALEVHEKETMPSIQLKTDLQTVPLAPLPQPTPPPAPTAPSPPPQAQQIRARVLAKSFDEDSTEASTPAIAEPAPLPSIVIDGLPSEPVRTELDMPAQQGVAPQAPPAARASKISRAPKKASKPPRAKEPKADRSGERPMPRAKPPPPQRTDTQVLSAVSERAPAPAQKSSSKLIWLVLPALALAAVAAFIGWDVYSDKMHRQEQADAVEAETVPEVPPPEVKPPPRREPEPEAPKEEAPKVEAPKKKPQSPPPQPRAKADGTPGELALRSLQGDFAKLVDEAVQRKFRLQVSALEGQVDARGSDPAFVKKVQSLHEQVKTALAKQQ